MDDVFLNVTGKRLGDWYDKYKKNF
jgi:hypothetical protein